MLNLLLCLTPWDWFTATISWTAFDKHLQIPASTESSWCPPECYFLDEVCFTSAQFPPAAGVSRWNLTYQFWLRRMNSEGLGMARVLWGTKFCTITEMLGWSVCVPSLPGQVKGMHGSLSPSRLCLHFSFPASVRCWSRAAAAASRVPLPPGKMGDDMGSREHLVPIQKRAKFLP